MSPSRVRIVALVALAVAVALATVPATGRALVAPTSAPVSDVPAPSGSPPVAVKHLSGHAAVFPAAVPRGAAGGVWYTQEGATISELNNSPFVSGFHSLSVTIPLVASPYPIGYELNGLSSTGDWYQVLVGDNWPGCPGYEMLFEVWDNTGAGFPPGCDTTVPMSTGNTIRLGINFTASHQVCLDLFDVTTGSGHSVCQAQPDGGATEFVLQSQASNVNGYFTGPMTEIANISASGCPDYTHMPVVNYEWPVGTWITGYLSWSDEFEVGGSGTFCYGGGSGASTIGRGDPATYYVDTASGTSYGPHVIAGQNYSMVNPAFGFRLQTDPVPLTFVTLSSSASLIAIGSNVTLTTTVFGGVPPYTTLWVLNGSLQGPGGLVRVFNGTASGTYRFSVYGVDTRLDVVGPSNVVTVQVNAPLSVSAIRVDSVSGNADVGQSVQFAVTPGGGIPSYSYAWAGLPSECPAVDASAVTCVPAVVGTYSISVWVTDSNGTFVISPSILFAVSPALTASLVASGDVFDVNQSVHLFVTPSGGSGGNQFAWSGLPAGCPAPSTPSATCRVASPGAFIAIATVTDSNGASTDSPGAAFTVYPDPTVALASARTFVDAGTNVTFAAATGGGAGGISFTWSGLPAGCASANTIELTCYVPTPGTLNVSVHVVDAVGGTADSPPLVLFAYPALAVSLEGPETVVVGETLTLTATVSGGSPGALLHWTGLPDGCAPPPGPTLVCTPNFAGTYNITVQGSDSGGGVGWVTTSVSVAYPSPAPSLLGSTTGLIVLGVVLGAVALVAAAIVVRRRGSVRQRGPERP